MEYPKKRIAQAEEVKSVRGGNFATVGKEVFSLSSVTGLDNQRSSYGRLTVYEVLLDTFG